VDVGRPGREGSQPRNGTVAVLFALLGLHAVLAASAAPLQRRLGRGVFLVAALAPLSTVAYAAARAGEVLAGRAVTETLAWAPQLGLEATLRLDAFALLMVALVSGIGVCVFVYAAGYFSADAPKLGTFAATLTAFSGAMLGLVLADNLVLLYVFWELTTIASYLLIGYDDRRADARSAALQALLTTTAGGLAMLAGFVLIGEAAGTYALSGIIAAPPSGTTAAVGLALICVGAFAKSAQVPLHTWLPAAMAAPTPVSAYLHSATMVKAGVYLIARLAPAFAVSVAWWRPAVVGVGVATMLVGGYRALRQHDLKLLLAFGTVSQLGFLIALFGAGTPAATFAGAALLLAHGLFKAALFMVVGIVDHSAHTRDLRRLHGLARGLPAAFAVAAIAGASMAGLPPLLGFISKEAAYEAFLHGDLGGLALPGLIGVVAGSVLTFAYTARFLHGGFGVKRAGDDLVGPDVSRPSPGLLGAPALLAAVTVVAGVAPVLVDDLVNRAAAALEPGWTPEPLALWHGFTPALAASLLTIALGAALWLAREPVERLQAALAAPLGADQAYDATVAGTLRGANAVTGVVQPGSLPLYLGVILLVAVLLPLSGLLGTTTPEPPPFAANALQAVIGAVIVVAACATVVARRRFTAVLFVGAAGFGVAAMFVIQGAPDVALTQLLIETLSLILFVLVLRFLPDRFARNRLRGQRAVRAAIALAVGLFVSAFALVAAAARTAPKVSGEFLSRSYAEADGANVVNVILVDFRGLDTLGEITVLLVAALGIAGLVRVGHLEDRRARRFHDDASASATLGGRGTAEEAP